MAAKPPIPKVTMATKPGRTPPPGTSGRRGGSMRSTNASRIQDRRPKAAGAYGTATAAAANAVRKTASRTSGNWNYTPTSGGGGKWTTRRGDVIGTGRSEDAPIKPVGKPSTRKPTKGMGPR